MSLVFQLQQTPLRIGAQEGDDPRHLPFGSLTRAENLRWSTTSRLEKRQGVTLFNYNGAPVAGRLRRLFTRGVDICATDGSSVYSYSSARGFTKVDPIPDVGLAWSTFLDHVKGAHAFDLAINNGIAFCAWVTGASGLAATTAQGAVWFAAWDTASKTFVRAPEQMTTAETYRGVRVVVAGSYAHILAANGSNIQASAVNLSTYAYASFVTLPNLTDARAGYGWDATAYVNTGSSTSGVAVAYEVTGGTGPLRIRAYTYAAGSYANVVTRNSAETGNSFPSVSIACGDDSGTAWSTWVFYACTSRGTYALDAWITGASSVVNVLSSSTLVASGSRSPRTSIYMPVPDGSSGIVVSMFDSYNPDNNLPSRGTITCQLNSNGSLVSNSVRGTGGTLPASRLFGVGGRVFMVLADFERSAGTYHSYSGTNTYLVEVETTGQSATGFEPHKYIGKIDHLTGATTAPSSLCSGVALSSTKALVFTPYMASATVQSENWRLGIRAIEVTLPGSTPADMWRGVNYGSETYIAAGSLQAYDGASCFDYGFPRAASFNNSVNVSAGGAMTANVGTHLYSTVVEYRSAAGLVHRSPTNTMASAVTTTGTNGTVTYAVMTPSLTRKQQARGYLNETLALYRTATNLTVPYRLTYEPSYNYYNVDSRVAYQTVTDTVTDSDVGAGVALASRPILYTVGGILDDEAPPALQTVCVHRNRLWGVDGSGLQIWFSKSFTDDSGVAPGFSSSFVLRSEEAVTALASMDDKLIVFSEEGISYVLGDGPAPNGANNDITGPIKIQSDVGCSNPRSVVTTPAGVMFQSVRGIYLLTRGLEVFWIGKPIKDTLASYPSVTSAVLVPKYNEVRFTANTAEGNAGLVLVFNYIEKQWTTNVYTMAGNSGYPVYGAPIWDAVLWNGVYTMAAFSYLYFESDTSWLDDGAWVPSTLETAWINAAGPLAYQSARAMEVQGESYSNHDLTVSVAFDSETSYTQTKTFVAGSPVTTVGPLEECSITIGTRRKCKAIRFKLNDATPTSPGTYPVGTGRGFSVNTIGLEFGVKKGFAVNPAAKKG